MMISDLPMDLVHEILSRVPATSLRRLRSSCKLLYALFKDQGFTEMHYRKAAKQYLVLILKDFRISSMSVNLNAHAPSAEFKSELELKESFSTNSKQVDIFKVFHCDGLLLCTTNTKDNRFVVWNPCLGETRWIQLLKTGYKGFSIPALGYQKTKSCNRYKILRCWHCCAPYHHVVGFEIYDFSTNSWRVDDVALDCYFISNIGVSLKGNTYWLATYQDINKYSLVCFDFRREKFKSMCPLPFVRCGWMALSSVREEQLSVLYHNLLSSKMEIWMTKNIDTDTEDALLWKKSFMVDSLPHIISDCFLILESFLIDQEKKLVLCCSVDIQTNERVVYIIGVESGCYTQIPYEESTKKLWVGPTLFSYVPSLVQIQ